MTTDYVGYGVIDRLQNVVEEYDSGRVLLFTGKRSYEESGAREWIEATLDTYSRFSSVDSNPTFESVLEGMRAVEQIDPDVVIAVGGGSVIDFSKAATALAAQEGPYAPYVEGNEELSAVERPLIALPTTAGTGSETTPFSTIYVENEKYSLSSPQVVPDAAVVDPSLTSSVPRYIAATTGLDAFCQAIESLWATNSTPESRRYAKDAIRLSLRYLERAVNSPDPESRTGMAVAAYLSGKAISVSKTTACHSVSYPMTSFLGVAHGHAVALTTPAFIKYNADSTNDCIDDRGDEFVNERIRELCSLLDCKSSNEAARTFTDLMESLGVETTLRGLGIDRQGKRQIIEHGFKPNRMDNNPRRVEEADLEQLLDTLV